MIVKMKPSNQNETHGTEFETHGVKVKPTECKFKIFESILTHGCVFLSAVIDHKRRSGKKKKCREPL